MLHSIQCTSFNLNSYSSIDQLKGTHISLSQNKTLTKHPNLMAYI